MRLVADIGGTNTRLAFSYDGQVHLETIKRFRNDDYDSAEALLHEYLLQHAHGTVSEIAIAMAGSVQQNVGRLTNRDWTLDATAFAKRFSIEQSYLLNDLVALGYSVPFLQDKQLTMMRKAETEPSQDYPALVVGIGTGFNACPVLDVDGTIYCQHVEVGHTSLPSNLANALERDNINPKDFPTIESLFSGPGFETFCQKVLNNDNISGREVLNEYGHAEISDNIVHRYGELIGWLLRDLTLAYMPTGGIYCTGGMARQILARAAKECSAILAPHHEIIALKTPPIQFIKDDFAALYGCANFRNNP